jgi:cell division protein FtsN
MSNKIDNLFNGKLSDHSLTPSAEAWSRIESGLSKKNKFVIVWRAAAVFVLLGLLTGSWFYWQSKQNDHETRLVTKEPVPNKITQEVNSEVKETPVAPLQKTESVPQIAADTKQEKNKPVTQEQKKLMQQPQVALNKPEPIKVEEIEQVKIETVEVTQVTKAEKPIVIEFTLEPVTQNTIAVAQATETEKPALKKIWDKALDIKNGDTELGGLRMAKNELFAFDFRKDKSKRN